MRIALIINDKVVNIIVSNDFSVTPDGHIAVVLEENEGCVIGQEYDQNSTPRFFGSVALQSQSWSAYQFLLRFTPEERALFRAAAVTDPNVADFQQLAQAAQEVVNDDPMTIAGMDYLTAIGLISQNRRNEILGF